MKRSTRGIVVLAIAMATPALGQECVGGATVESIACRLDAVRARIAADDLGRIGTRVDKNLARAEGLVDRAAEACLAEPAAAKKPLRRAVRVMIRAARPLRSLRGRRNIEPTLRGELVAETASVIDDLKRLRRAPACPASPSGAFLG